MSTNLDIIPPTRKELKNLIKSLDKNTFYTISRREAPKNIIYNSKNEKELRENLSNSQSLFYIYTSGTTGMPKASNFSHQKFLVGCGLQMFSLQMKPTDKTYMVLPLYHVTGGVVGIGSTFCTGGTVVLRKKFSVEKFWEDCVKYEVTVITYIGELFRYLVAGKENDYEKKHKIRGIYGNGLRPEVWKVVQERFGINILYVHFLNFLYI